MRKPIIFAGLLFAAACEPMAPSDIDQAAVSEDAARAQLIIDGLDGEITKTEVDAFLSVVSGIAIPTSQFPNGRHNYLADGTGGTILEAINRLYEITGDIPALSSEHVQFLDLAIRWSDTWLTHRNDLPLGEGRVMWTGNVDPVWPPDAPPSTYAGCEVGETVGIIAYTALNIVNTRALWSKTVPDGDPNRFGATYLARAKTYVAMLEYSMDNYFNKYFLDKTKLTIHRPSAAAYGNNNVNAWNREMMFLHAWQTLAQLHEALGDDSKRAEMYRAITKNTVDLFVKNALPSTAPDGTAVYDWGYGNFGDVTGRHKGEEIGIHGSYDIWGLTRAYRAGYTSATAKQMQTYADTVVHEMALPSGVYSGTVDRSGTGHTYTYLPPGFMYLAPYGQGLYQQAANIDIQSGAQKGSVALTAGILWAKHELARGSGCTPTTCAAQGKECGSISDGCGATLACGSCATGETCSAANVCQSSGSCAPTLASYRQGRCKGTAIYGGKLYECISQALNINGETSGCGAAGVYCSNVPPDDAAWGTTAWRVVQGCN